MSEIESYSISGDPSDEESAAILAALEALLQQEKRSKRPSAWKFYSRGVALGLGASELRHRVTRRWDITSRIGWQGAAPHDMRGRGDAK